MLKFFLFQPNLEDDDDFLARLTKDLFWKVSSRFDSSLRQIANNYIKNLLPE